MNAKTGTVHRPGWPSNVVGPGREAWEAFARLATDEQIELALVAAARLVATRNHHDQDHGRATPAAKERDRCARVQ